MAYCRDAVVQPGTQAFSSRSFDLARTVMTSPAIIPRAHVEYEMININNERGTLLTFIQQAQAE